MSSDSVGSSADNKANNNKNDTNNGAETPSESLVTKKYCQNTQSANASQQKSHKRDWLDKANLVVLILAFLAAAACEADRLANLTKKAIDNADAAAQTQAADTATALGLSKQAADAALKQASAAEMQVYVLRANMRQDAIDPQPIIQNGSLTGWNMTPIWHNVGGTDAINVAAWWGIFVVPTDPISVANCPILAKPTGNIPPSSIAPGGMLLEGAQILTTSQATSVTGTPPAGIIYIAGHIEYRDIFPKTPVHVLDWCVKVIPNDIPMNKFSYINMYQIITEYQAPGQER